MAARFSDPGMYAEGFAKRTASGPRWTGKVALIPEKLGEPLSWKKPKRVFVNSMSDLFHEELPFEHIAAVFGVMAACPHITFQVLTKRPGRAAEFFRWIGDGAPVEALGRIAAVVSGRDLCDLSDGRPWPLPNVWLGTSVENQETADERIPKLLECPAAVRFISYEPALGGVSFDRGGWLRPTYSSCQQPDSPVVAAVAKAAARRIGWAGIDWIIVGGESGPGARPFDIEWARSTVQQCKAAGVPVFCKQMGSFPVDVAPVSQRWISTGDGIRYRVPLKDRKGGDPEEWPAGYWPREFPEALSLKGETTQC